MSKTDDPNIDEKEIVGEPDGGEETAEKSETGESAAGSEKDAEIAKLKDQMLRQLAEYDNYRKRTARERLEIEADTIAKTAAEFLPVLDNLDRALSHECTDEKFKKGVEMIRSSFLETLEKLGVEEIVTDGEEFNPAIHQAVQRVEESGAESGTICETFQKGYKIGEKVIRFAMVAVAN